LADFFGWFKRHFNSKNSDTSDLVLSEDKIKRLENLIGQEIRNIEYFVQALTHRSFLEVSEEHNISNERLEFLGDSVLNLIVGEFLFKEFANNNEGFLTKARANLVNRNVLADTAQKINLGELLLINKNISTSFELGAKTILSDAFEALVGAIYLDSGFQSSQKFILNYLIHPQLEEGSHLADENYKSQLLEYIQANKLDLPQYIVAKEEGPHHDKTFTIKVYIGSKELGTGLGKNKKSAEQNAAKEALENLLHLM
jgi:ribonuclease III